MQNTSIFHPLAVNQFWYALLEPMTAVLADNCQLSMSQVRQALPTLLHVNAYQLLNITEPSKDKTFQPFHSVLQDDILTNFDIKNGVDFAKLQALDKVKSTYFQQIFGKNTQLLLGFLLAKTNLPKTSLEQLWQWVTLFAMKALSDFYQQNKSHQLLTDKAWTAWLQLQKHALITADSFAICQAIGFYQPFAVTSANKQMQILAKQAPMPVMLQQLQAFVDNYHLNIGGKPKTNTATSSTTQKINHDIFATPKPKNNWVDYLQKYWIATAMVLSVVAIGGVGLLLPKSEKTQQNTTNQADKAQKTYQDVAIVKISSTATASTPTANKQSSKTTEKTTATKTADKKSDKPKTTAKKDTVKKETAKKDTTKKETVAKTTQKDTAKKSDVKKSDVKKSESKKDNSKTTNKDKTNNAKTKEKSNDK
ncbi:hypothetical protein ACGTJS_00790 [Faucicola mancuniensis]|uniref:hypothetical protein n=1 Tax=Faucicola mancuniensis TaxID=1309795 RepID=UPI00397798EA